MCGLVFTSLRWGNWSIKMELSSVVPLFHCTRVQSRPQYPSKKIVCLQLLTEERINCYCFSQEQEKGNCRFQSLFHRILIIRFSCSLTHETVPKDISQGNCLRSIAPSTFFCLRKIHAYYLGAVYCGFSSVQIRQQICFLSLLKIKVSSLFSSEQYHVKGSMVNKQKAFSHF